MFLCFEGPAKAAGAMPGEGRPTISDELTSGKPCKRQTSIRPGAAILGGCIPLCDVPANALKQFRNTGAAQLVASLLPRRSSRDAEPLTNTSMSYSTNVVP